MPEEKQEEVDQPVYCNNCDWKGLESQLGANLFETKDLHDRLEPGEETPAGECPECGALCYLENPPEHTAAGQLKKMKAERENGPANIEIKRWINAGELGDVSEIGSTEVLLQRLGEIIDNSHASEIFGSAVYQTVDGNYHIVSIEGVLTPIDESFANNFGDTDEKCAACGTPYAIDDNDKPGSPRWEGFCSTECLEAGSKDSDE